MKKIIPLFLGIVWLGGVRVLACDCAPEKTVREEYNRADFVYTAYVQRVSTEPDPTFPGTSRQVANTSVRQAWKGLHGRREAIVRPASDTSMCGYSFRAGETYLIYGYIDASGALLTSYCHRTKLISEAGYDLEELNKIIGE